jgi:hypothetical protein
VTVRNFIRAKTLDGEEDGLLILWIARQQQASIRNLEYVITLKHCQDAVKSNLEHYTEN